MQTKKEYELYIQKTVAYIQSRKMQVVGVDKLYDNAETPDNLIARIALFKHLPLLLELYTDESLGLYVNMFDCDPLTAAVFTKELMPLRLTHIDGFVAMKSINGELQTLLFGEDALEQFKKEKDTRDLQSTHLN